MTEGDENKDKPQVSTKVKLGDTEVEIRNMPTATGLNIYRTLPADYQQQARHISEVVTVFGSFAEVGKKHNISPTELAKDWLRTASSSEAAKAERKNFSAAKKTAFEELKALNIDVASVARMFPGGDALVGAAHTASGAATVIGAAGTAVGAAADGAWNGAPRMWNLLDRLYQEGKGKIFGYGSGAPKDDALAFGAAVMALRYQSVEERHKKPMMDMPFNGKESQFEANPGAVALSGWDAMVQWIKINMPLVSAVYNYLTTWGENKPTWDQFKQAAYAESKALESGKAKTFQQQVDARMIPADNEHATEVLKAAEVVAGLQTREGLAEVATGVVSDKKITYRDNKGNDVTLDQGQPVAMKTPGDRIKDAAQAITGDGPAAEQAIRVGATVIGAATVTNNGVKGLVRGLTANVEHPRPATEKIMKWADKPAQVGFGNHAWSTGAKAWINFPGKIAVGVGDLAGRAVRQTGNFFVGAKNMVVGGVKGVHEVVNDATTVANSNSKWAEGFSKSVGKTGAVLVAAVPAATTFQTLRDIGEEKYDSAALHGAETVGLATMMLKGGIKMGLKRVPLVAPVVSGVEVVNAAISDDKGGMVKAGTELGTTGTGAAIGAGIGAWFAGVGAIPGAAVGATIGGIAGIFTGTMAENHFVKGQSPIAENKPASRTTASNPTPMTPEQLSAAHDGVIQQARDACRAQGNKGVINFNLGTGFSKVDCTAIGALGNYVASGSGGKARTNTAQPSPTS